MALHTLKPVLGRMTRSAILGGSFGPNGTGAPAVVKGKGFTVVRSDVGKFTVTLDDNYHDIVSVSARLQTATADADVELLNVTAGSGTTRGTFVLQVIKRSDLSALELNADAQNRVNFVIILQDGVP